MFSGTCVKVAFTLYHVIKKNIKDAFKNSGHIVYTTKKIELEIKKYLSRTVHFGCAYCIKIYTYMRFNDETQELDKIAILLDTVSLVCKKF